MMRKEGEEKSMAYDEEEVENVSHKQKARVVEESPKGTFARFNEKIGEGAYKKVYRAWDSNRGVEVAWNVCRIAPKGENKRVVQEMKILQSLDHPNIIKFYGSWVNKEEETVVFVTELMSSGTLKEFTRTRPVRLCIVKKWCKQILKALQYLHSFCPPIIHRDLKPDNLFIDGSTGEIRVGDLGLASWDRGDNRTQSTIGTPEYMAPELYEECYDEQVDIYAFGMCVLEIITGEEPYAECTNAAQVFRKVISGVEPRYLHRIDAASPVGNFIRKCIERPQPGCRRPSASQLLDDLFLEPSQEDDVVVSALLLPEDELLSPHAGASLEPPTSGGESSVQPLKIPAAVEKTTSTLPCALEKPSETLPCSIPSLQSPAPPPHAAAAAQTVPDSPVSTTETNSLPTAETNVSLVSDKVPVKNDSPVYPVVEEFPSQVEIDSQDKLVVESKSDSSDSGSEAPSIQPLFGGDTSLPCSPLSPMPPYSPTPLSEEVSPMEVPSPISPNNFDDSRKELSAEESFSFSWSSHRRGSDHDTLSVELRVVHNGNKLRIAFVFDMKKDVAKDTIYEMKRVGALPQGILESDIGRIADELDVLCQQYQSNSERTIFRNRSTSNSSLASVCSVSSTSTLQVPFHMSCPVSPNEVIQVHDKSSQQQQHAPNGWGDVGQRASLQTPPVHPSRRLSESSSRPTLLPSSSSSSVGSAGSTLSEKELKKQMQENEIRRLESKILVESLEVGSLGQASQGDKKNQNGRQPITRQLSQNSFLAASDESEAWPQRMQTGDSQFQKRHTLNCLYTAQR